jgi:hypothetical protein
VFGFQRGTPEWAAMGRGLAATATESAPVDVSLVFSGDRPQLGSRGYG